MILALVTTAALQVCPALTMDGARALARKNGETTIVFFASWCADCKENLAKTFPSNTIVVATFDEKDAAEKAVNTLGVKLPCYLDDGVAAALGVKSVPSQRVVK